MGYGIAIHRTVEDYRNQNLLQNWFGLLESSGIRWIKTFVKSISYI